jgi:SnoaL-like domain
MAKSPIERLVAAFDALDVEGVMALVAPDAEMRTADGRRAEGRQAVRDLVGSFIADLRSTSHRITAEWHQDDVWIAEIDASYELRDWLRLSSLPRAFILEQGPDGIRKLRVYGEHERPLTEHRTGEEGMVIGDRWIPPL